MNLDTIAICTYREWGLKVFDSLKTIFPKMRFVLIKNQEEFLHIYSKNLMPDLIFCVGWSFKIDENIIKEKFVVGVHPSDLPHFSGGSPIQNQILSGINFSKISLFKLTEKLDAGPLIDKLPLSLEGHMSEIFDRLHVNSTILFVNFINKYPDNIKLCNQTVSHENYRRLKPKDSEITKEKVFNMTARELYNFIRCREDPYPNCFLKDHTGKLIFKICEFQENEEQY